jgi:hypothetical protein
MSKQRIAESLRRVVMERASFRCEYCLSPMEFATQRFQIDHILPVSKGGLSNSDNLALACNGCNNHKHNKIAGFDAINGTDVLLFDPRTQPWHEHFAWGVDLAFVVGLTPSGRATVDTLQLNRPELLTMRRILQRVHLHPPVTSL